MKILSVIGTRPQYVKIKPIFDFCNENKINHVIVDTNQHYSKNVSDYFINEFSLIINHNLQVNNSNELHFITKTMEMFAEVIDLENPDFVLIYGDTNSTLSSSLVCYKKNIPFAHVEAGLRCGNIKALSIAYKESIKDLPTPRLAINIGNLRSHISLRTKL